MNTRSRRQKSDFVVLPWLAVLLIVLATGLVYLGRSQPSWWRWLLVEATGVSPAPLIYAAFFAAISYRVWPIALNDAPVRDQ